MDSKSQYFNSLVAKYAIPILLVISSYSAARYLNTPWTLITWLVLLFLCFLATRVVSLEAIKKYRMLSVIILLFTLIFDASMILGAHIVIGSAGTYSGLVDENYIANFRARDAFSFFLILPSLFVLFAAPAFRCRDTATNSSLVSTRCLTQECARSSLRIKPVLVLSTIIFIGWIPYIVIYWPGFIFNDSIGSLNQIFGYAQLSNHHPIVYTAYLGIWIRIANACGLSATWGIGLSSIAQSALLSLTLGYLSRWIVARGGLKQIIGVVMAIVFAVSPYIATYGIALWKDPLFSAALVLFTLCLADFILSKGSVVEKRYFLPFVGISALAMVFFRNNGIYILFATIAILVVLHKHWKKQGFKGSFMPFTAQLIGVAAVYIVATSLIFPAIGVQPTEKAESIGVPLNQMARVAAIDGKMTDSDREFLNELLPYDEYQSTYTPCCTDAIKCSPNFNGTPLEEGMWSHWLSMLIQNPKSYLESWVLQTFGFWTVNTEQQVSWSWNIGGGIPWNIDPALASQLNKYDNTSSNPAALDSEWYTMLLPCDDWSVPISWLTWAVAYLAILLIARNKRTWIVMLVPVLTLILTLIIASPTCYWPRYGAALQFLIPMFGLIYYAIVISNNESLRHLIEDKQEWQ